MARCLDSAHRRHVQIHDDDVRRQLPDEAHRLAPVCALADHLERALLLEEVAQARPEEIVVVHEQDADLVPAAVLLVESVVHLCPLVSLPVVNGT